MFDIFDLDTLLHRFSEHTSNIHRDLVRWEWDSEDNNHLVCVDCGCKTTDEHPSYCVYNDLKESIRHELRSALLLSLKECCETDDLCHLHWVEENTM